MDIRGGRGRIGRERIYRTAFHRESGGGQTSGEVRIVELASPRETFPQT